MAAPSQHGRRRPLLPVVAGAVGSVVLALSMSGTLSAFTASVTNTVNTAGTGYLAMRETLLDSSGAPTTVVCNSNDGTPTSVTANAATCATINKYGGTATPLRPGGAPNVTDISITNTGTADAASFTLTPGTCTATAGQVHGSADPATVCGQFIVTISSGGTTVWSGRANAMPASIDLLGPLGLTGVTAGASVPLRIAVQLAPDATNAYSGFTISQPLTWTFTA